MESKKTETITNDGVQPVPENALSSMAEEIKKSGGEWVGNPEDQGAIGWTAFDSPSSDDGTITVLLPKDTILELPHQSLVRITSRSDHRTYLGVIVEGPFAEPDGLKSDAPVIVTATVRGRGNILISTFHGRVQVELIGEELPDGGTIPPRRRPLPNSPVFPLSSDETAKVLRTTGNIRLGIAESHDDIVVGIPSSKSVLPRHLGVLGTTGGGKSTTVSGLVSQLQMSNSAVILLDTEGEYTSINQPTEDPVMIKALERRNLKPEGVQNTHVYHLLNRETTNPHHPSLIPFSLSFAELSPYAVIEILNLSDAQQERYLKAYDVCKLAMEKLGIFPVKPEEKESLMELDELETGYPKMKLGHLYDMVNIIASLKNDDTFPFVLTKEFFQHQSEIKALIAQSNVPGHIPSWRALQGRLGRIKRLGLFDSPEISSIALIH